MTRAATIGGLVALATIPAVAAVAVTQMGADEPAQPGTAAVTTTVTAREAPTTTAPAPTTTAAAPTTTVAPRRTRRRSAGAVTRDPRGLARLECRDDRFDDPVEFRLRYGSGSRALRRCVDSEIAQARADCREDAREDPFDFQGDYGTGSRGMSRCLIDELG